MTGITQILNQIRDGEEGAVDVLLSEVYGELRKLAAGKMAKESPGQTLQATALVHEAWLKIADENGPQFENRKRFFAAAGEAMRRILVDRARRRGRLKHGGAMNRVDVEPDAVSANVPDVRILEVHEALEALEKEDPVKADVVKLKFFVGMNATEIADSLGISLRSVERYWSYSSAWMLSWLENEKETSQ